MAMRSLRQTVEEEAAAAGLLIEDLASAMNADDFGDGHLVGRLGPIAVRFVRERGQDWLELGPIGQPVMTYYSFQDVQIALGWKTISDVIQMKDVEPLQEVLKRIASRWSEIASRLSGNCSDAGWRRIAEAAAARANAFEARLR